MWRDSACVSGLDATDSREPAFSTEPFCSILSETEAGSNDPVEFLDRAVDFANNRLWGTLSADVVIHPKLLKDPRIAKAFERAIIRLRYGAVTVNSWTGFVFATSVGFKNGQGGIEPSTRDFQSGLARLMRACAIWRSCRTRPGVWRVSAPAGGALR